MSDIKIRKIQEFSGHREPIYGMDIDLQNNRIYSTGGDGMVIRWTLGNEAPGEAIAKLNNAGFALKLISESTLAVAENHVGLHLIDVKTQRLIHSYDLGKHFYFDIQSIGEKLWVLDNAGNIRICSSTSTHETETIKVSQKSLRNIEISQKHIYLSVPIKI